MTFQMDASGDADYNKVGAGFQRLPPGRFHVEIIEVDESFQKQADKVVVVFDVLAGTVPDRVGRRHTEFFSTSPGAMDRLKRLAMVCDLIKPGEQRDVSFNDAVGADLVIEIVPHSYEKDGKTIETTQLDFGGMWSTSHEEVREVPKGKKPEREQSSDQGGSDADAWQNV